MILKIYDILFTIITGKPNIKKLKKDGLVIGNNVNIQRGVIIDKNHCWLIEIGDNVTLAPKVHILAHDASTKIHIGYTKIGTVKIEDNVFIGANSIILPNVKIGKNSIIACNSVVTKNVKANSVYGGTPAKFICSLDKYLKKYKELDLKYIFEDDYTIHGGITQEKKQYQKEIIKDKIGLVK